MFGLKLDQGHLSRPQLSPRPAPALLLRVPLLSARNRCWEKCWPLRMRQPLSHENLVSRGVECVNLGHYTRGAPTASLAPIVSRDTPPRPRSQGQGQLKRAVPKDRPAWEKAALSHASLSCSNSVDFLQNKVLLRIKFKDWFSD